VCQNPRRTPRRPLARRGWHALSRPGNSPPKSKTSRLAVLFGPQLWHFHEGVHKLGAAASFILTFLGECLPSLVAEHSLSKREVAGPIPAGGYDLEPLEQQPRVFSACFQPGVRNFRLTRCRILRHIHGPKEKKRDGGGSGMPARRRHQRVAHKLAAQLVR
jgi:hypothetical protein